MSNAFCHSAPAPVKGRTAIIDGTVVYRTKLLPENRAKSFAACLNKNHNFMNAYPVRSETARGENFFVTFKPRNGFRQMDMKDAQKLQRIDRADAQGPAFSFWPCGILPHTAYCFKGVGTVYTLTTSAGHAVDCDCGDRVYRGRESGISCKHMISFNANPFRCRECKEVFEPDCDPDLCAECFDSRGLVAA